MMIVPGSMPRMMVDFFCTKLVIFSTLIITLTLCIEQKYQNIHQLVSWTVAGGVVVLLFVSPGKSATRPGICMDHDQNSSFWRYGMEVLAGDRDGVCQLGH